MPKKQIIILLSSKSSGSSAFQKYLVENYGFGTIPNTLHWENETLYWTKVASVLAMKQDAMHRSHVPYSRTGALISLGSMLKSNGVRHALDKPKKEELFELFFRLTEAVDSALVVEKSPHHLFNYANLELIFQFKEYIKERATVVIMGLVRNPLDSIYSARKRWRFNCSAFEAEWKQSYANLRSLLARETGMGWFRYEDLVHSTERLDHYLMVECGLEKKGDGYTWKSGSLQQWKHDFTFSHRLKDESIRLAGFFGYQEVELRNETKAGIRWWSSELFNSFRYQIKRARKHFRKKAG